MRQEDDVMFPRPVDQETWGKRRQEFSLIESRAIHTTGWRKELHERSFVLERELERCYLSGVWLSCITLATAIVEACLGHNSGKARTCRTENAWMVPILLPMILVQELRGWRNSLVHLANEKYAVTEAQYFDRRDELGERAGGACLLGLSALFLTGTCEQREIHEPRLREIFQMDMDDRAEP